MQRVEKAIEKIFTKKEIYKLLILFVVSFVFSFSLLFFMNSTKWIMLVLFVLLMGFYFEYAHQLMKNANAQLPSWKNIFKIFITGLKPIIASGLVFIIFTLPIFLITIYLITFNISKNVISMFFYLYTIPVVLTVALIFFKYIGRLSLIYAKSLKLLDFINFKKAQNNENAIKLEKYLKTKPKQTPKSQIEKVLIACIWLWLLCAALYITYFYFPIKPKILLILINVFCPTIMAIELTLVPLIINTNIQAYHLLCEK